MKHIICRRKSDLNISPDSAASSISSNISSHTYNIFCLCNSKKTTQSVKQPRRSVINELLTEISRIVKFDIKIR